MPRSFLAPPLLRPGDPVAVVAPSGPIDVEPFERGLATLRERYDVRVWPNLGARERFFAGGDARRANELQQAVDDPAIRAIFCARGGYGATRILGDISTDTLRDHPKWLVGYSDITALHARWALAGVQSIHGPNVQGLPRDAESLPLLPLFSLLENDAPFSFPSLWTLNEHETTGPLLGGNLSLLCALLGTPDFPPLEGAVLLLEDVNEKPYRVDRMLTQLRRAGVLSRVAGVALGRFSASQPDESNGVTVEDVLAERLGDLGVPVVAGLPIGHDGVNASVRLGAVVRIAGDRLQYPSLPSAGD